MSRNLVIKQMFTAFGEQDKRVIDTNALVEKRIARFAAEMQKPENDGFSAGLDAERVEGLLAEEDEEGQGSGNVIKASEEAERILEQARGEAEQIAIEAQERAAKIVQDAETQAEVQKQSIFNDAKNQGYAAGVSQAEEEALAARRELEEQKAALEESYEVLLDEVEPKLVDAITSVYEQIFNIDLTDHREILLHLISNTLHKTEGTTEFIIHVSKEDYPFVSMQKKQLLSGVTAQNSKAEVIEDLALAPNDCIIETDGGVFDCGLGTELAELKKKLCLLSWSKEG